MRVRVQARVRFRIVATVRVRVKVRVNPSIDGVCHKLHPTPRSDTASYRHLALSGTRCRQLAPMPVATAR